MAFDYKKEYKEFYMPKNKPSILQLEGKAIQMMKMETIKIQLDFYMQLLLQ